MLKGKLCETTWKNINLLSGLLARFSFPFSASPAFPLITFPQHCVANAAKTAIIFIF